MNNEVLAKRIKADGMKLDYRSELARISGENVIYKTLLAYADLINDFMLDGRTFEYTPEQVINYISSMSGCMMQQINIIRGVSDMEFINHILDEMTKDIPEYIKDQFDELPDNPIYNGDNSWINDIDDYDDYDGEDEDEE